MRRKDRLLSSGEALSVLLKGDFGILSTVSPDGLPYGVPLHYCMVNSCIYIHSALEGEKILNIETNSAVSFCVVGDTQVEPEKFATKYESCIVQGTVQEVFGDEKKLALEELVKKYSARFIPEGNEYIKRAEDKVKVFVIIPQNLSGKAKR